MMSNWPGSYFPKCRTVLQSYFRSKTQWYKSHGTLNREESEADGAFGNDFSRQVYYLWGTVTQHTSSVGCK